MAIYTKTGDKGKTGLFSKTRTIRVSKASQIINTIGAIDELNSYLGVCLLDIHRLEAREKMENIQSDLFTIGAILAGAKLVFDGGRIKILEAEIDKLEGTLPVLNHFILPGGVALSSHLFYARALARKAEREVVALSSKKNISPEILKYINRLSDYLFIIARLVNFKNARMETVWPFPQKSKNKTK